MTVSNNGCHGNFVTMTTRKVIELFRGIETRVLVQFWYGDTSWLKQSFPEMVARDGGVKSGDEL